MNDKISPNVLLITTDHWPASLMEPEGHPCILTPTLNALAWEGVRFTNAYSECPVCVPARRCLMTGLSPDTHGLNENGCEPLPDVTTLAQSFRNNGYQAYAVGKLHVTPQRSRIGFDEVILDEEGRASEGVGPDDYEIFLADNGHVGERFAGGMNNNGYLWRPWHLDERLHVTNWATTQMARTIRRRDPLRPAFWYLSYSHPHPPLAPLRDYLEIYRDAEIPEPYYGEWVENQPGDDRERHRIRDVRRAFYALCTHIDHQLRVVIGTLREEGVLDNTIIIFTADHGEMLGNHGLWAKRQFFEDSTRVPMLVWGTRDDERTPRGTTDDRLVSLADVMPTLHDLAGLPCPDHVEGRSMVGDTTHDHLYGNAGGSRMIRKGEYKLIYWPKGNVTRLFHVANDPQELHDLAGDESVRQIQDELTQLLVGHLEKSGNDEWLTDGQLTGQKPQQGGGGGGRRGGNRGLSGQRGIHWPPPPIKKISQV